MPKIGLHLSTPTSSGVKATLVIHICLFLKKGHQNDSPWPLHGTVEGVRGLTHEIDLFSMTVVAKKKRISSYTLIKQRC